LRGLFDEIRKALPRKKIAFNDSNNIDGLRSQLSSVRRKVKEAIEALSSFLDKAAKAEPKPTGNHSGEPIHVVFTSSTFDDLREERTAVQKAVPYAVRKRWSPLTNLSRIMQTRPAWNNSVPSSTSHVSRSVSIITISSVVRRILA
jgi:hypothetical protein